MHEKEQSPQSASPYPTGRGYGNDYLRGGEIFGGYGYAERPDYERRRGETSRADDTESVRESDGS